MKKLDESGTEFARFMDKNCEAIKINSNSKQVAYF